MKKETNRFINWLFRRNDEPVRKVLLVMFDNTIKIVRAHNTQSGWIARWINNDNQWSLLRPGGRVEGTTLVKRWLPHSGWDVAPDNPALPGMTKENGDDN